MDKKYKKCLDYIEQYWAEATFELKKDTKVNAGLPNKFVSPNATRFTADQFYWDSYFIILGLVVSGRVKLAKGMVENFASLYDRFGFIPVRNYFSSLSMSQPPFLTSMILEVYERDKDKKWLGAMARVAEGELKSYWQEDGSHLKDGWPIHLLPNGLSRYAGYYAHHFVAEYESGWDETSRFCGKCLDWAPVDLNSLLYKYESDLGRIYGWLGDKNKEKEFCLAAKNRRALMEKIFWSEKDGFYFDYDHKNKKLGSFLSLAGFYPLWAGWATEAQAKKAVKNLKKFETAGGLANTGKEGLSSEFKQWDYPNGWPNQQWIVIKGLLNYGFKKDAERLAKKWLELNRQVFEDTGKFWEKYDVVRGAIGKSEKRYETQSGFGWTNAVFLRLLKEVMK